MLRRHNNPQDFDLEDVLATSAFFCSLKLPTRLDRYHPAQSEPIKRLPKFSWESLFTGSPIGPILKFRTLPDSPGLYAVWEKDELVWVGAAGGSLRSRFERHVKAQSRGNPFCQGICDRLMFRHMNLEDSIRMTGETPLFADILAAKFVRNHLAYRFVPTQDNSIALTIASAICAGNTTLDKPFLNPK